ncbi:LacI family DNA-binding transcriptional regulator [Flavitalea flava]
MPVKRPTLQKMARQLGVSVSTVSRALQDHGSIGLGTKLKVRQLAEKLNYERNETAIFFKQQKKFTIGVILPELSESFFSTAMNGIEETANSNGYMVLVAQSHDMEEREKKAVLTMKDHRIDGLIISLSKNTSSYEHFEPLKKHSIPVVFFDRIPDRAAMPDLASIHYISCDMQSGTLQAIDFLFGKGHRVIGMINGPPKLFASGERSDGYKSAMEKNDIGFDRELIVATDLTGESTREAMRKLLSLEKRPTAILVFNDYVALDAIQYARQQKLRINKDISFVSYSNLPINNYMAYPPLASVEQYPYQQGKKATETLLEILRNAKDGKDTAANYHIQLASKLIVHRL